MIGTLQFGLSVSVTGQLVINGSNKCFDSLDFEKCGKRFNVVHMCR